MYLVIVMFKEQGMIQLVYDHHIDATRAYGLLATAKEKCSACEVSDEFGSLAVVDGRDIRATIIQDMNRHFEGAQNVQMLQQRANAKLQKAMAADPQLRILAPNGMFPPKGMAAS